MLIVMCLHAFVSKKKRPWQLWVHAPVAQSAAGNASDTDESWCQHSWQGQRHHYDHQEDHSDSLADPQLILPRTSVKHSYIYIYIYLFIYILTTYIYIYTYM